MNESTFFIKEKNSFLLLLLLTMSFLSTWPIHLLSLPIFYAFPYIVHLHRMWLLVKYTGDFDNLLPRCNKERAERLITDNPKVTFILNPPKKRFKLLSQQPCILYLTSNKFFNTKNKIIFFTEVLQCDKTLFQLIGSFLLQIVNQIHRLESLHYNMLESFTPWCGAGFDCSDNTNTLNSPLFFAELFQ